MLISNFVAIASLLIINNLINTHMADVRTTVQLTIEVPFMSDICTMSSIHGLQNLEQILSIN